MYFDQSLPASAGVYCIKNTVSGRLYVGSAINLRKRFCEHRRRLRLGNHHNEYLQKAWAKRGENAFVFEILELSDADSLREREQFHIDATACASPRYGYNISVTAERFTPTERSKQKIAEAKRGKPRSPETCRRMSLGRAGIIVSAETRRKISLASKGRPLSEAQKKANEARIGIRLTAEHVEKVRKALLGRTMTDEQRLKLSVIAKKRWADEQSRQKMCAALTGIKRKPFTAEHRSRMSVAASNRERQRRNLAARWFSK